MLINSGYGIHVYWVLTESISYAEWLPVAQGLKDMCIQHNLLADNGVTADAARVLRVPGTRNHKHDTQKEDVYFWLVIDLIKVEMLLVQFPLKNQLLYLTHSLTQTH